MIIINGSKNEENCIISTLTLLFFSFCAKITAVMPVNIYTYNSINLDVEHLRFTSPNPESHQLHSHAYFEVCCFLEGEAIYHIEGSEYPLQPGDVVILRPNEAHFIQLSSAVPFERILLSFGQNLLSALDPDKTFYPAFFHREPGMRNLYRASDFPELSLSEHFRRFAESQDRGHILTVLLAILKDLNLAFKRVRDHRQNTETLEAQLIRLINDNYHLSLTLDALSDRFFISRAQLCRRFQKATGTPIGRYITVKRLTAARQLLFQGRKAADVCAMCGFNDYSSFYRAYSRHFGHSPKAEK